MTLVAQGLKLLAVTNLERFLQVR